MDCDHPHVGTTRPSLACVIRADPYCSSVTQRAHRSLGDLNSGARTEQLSGTVSLTIAYSVASDIPGDLLSDRSLILWYRCVIHSTPKSFWWKVLGTVRQVDIVKVYRHGGVSRYQATRCSKRCSVRMAARNRRTRRG